jgi:hypothetical protein
MQNLNSIRGQFFLSKTFCYHLILSLFLMACASSTNQNFESGHFPKSKIKGIHVFSTGSIDSLNLIEIQRLNVDHLVLVPFFYQKGLNASEVKMSAKNGYEWTERDEGIKQITLDAKKIQN